MKYVKNMIYASVVVMFVGHGGEAFSASMTCPDGSASQTAYVWTAQNHCITYENCEGLSGDLCTPECSPIGAAYCTFSGGINRFNGTNCYCDIIDGCTNQVIKYCGDLGMSINPNTCRCMPCSYESELQCAMAGGIMGPSCYCGYDSSNGCNWHDADNCAAQSGSWNDYTCQCEGVCVATTHVEMTCPPGTLCCGADYTYRTIDSTECTISVWGLTSAGAPKVCSTSTRYFSAGYPTQAWCNGSNSCCSGSGCQ